MAAIGTMMVPAREANSLGTIRINSNPRPSSSSSSSSSSSFVLLPKSMNGSKTILKKAGEEQFKILERRVGKHNMADIKFVRGKIVNGMVDLKQFVPGKQVVNGMRIFSQNFKIRSYDTGPNHTATIETVMNLLQETLVNHLWSIGVLKDGFAVGLTPETTGKNLVWVLSKMDVVVDRYPSRGDEVRVDHWFIPSGKSGQASEWVICDSSTGQTLTRATSMLMIMNKETRKISKIPEEVKREMELQYIVCPPILDEYSSKLSKLDYSKMEYARTGVTPRWHDLDANHHVNNVKYVGLMLESVPVSFLRNHELSAITVEYRRECPINEVIQSLTSVCNETVDGSLSSGSDVECAHLLRFESGDAVTRGRTKWKPNHAKTTRQEEPVCSTLSTKK